MRHGGRAVDPQLAVDAWSESDPLNDRERQVLRLAGAGLSAGDFVTLLNLSGDTVRNYLSEAIGKLGAANRIEASRLVRQKGWLSLLFPSPGLRPLPRRGEGKALRIHVGRNLRRRFRR